MVHELGSPISEMNLVRKNHQGMAGVRTNHSIHHKFEMVYRKEYVSHFIN